MKAALLDVVKLQAQRLYAAYDSPLVTDQTDPDTLDVTEGEKEIFKRFRINSLIRAADLFHDKHLEKLIIRKITIFTIAGQIYCNKSSCSKVVNFSVCRKFCNFE